MNSTGLVFWRSLNKNNHNLYSGSDTNSSDTMVFWRDPTAAVPLGSSQWPMLWEQPQDGSLVEHVEREDAHNYFIIIIKSLDLKDKIPMQTYMSISSYLQMGVRSRPCHSLGIDLQYSHASWTNHSANSMPIVPDPGNQRRPLCPRKFAQKSRASSLWQWSSALNRDLSPIRHAEWAVPITCTSKRGCVVQLRYGCVHIS